MRFGRLTATALFACLLSGGTLYGGHGNYGIAQSADADAAGSLYQRSARGIVSRADNLLANTESLCGTGWTATNVTCSASAEVAPFDAAKVLQNIIENGVNATHQVSRSLTVKAGMVNTASGYCKANNRSWIRLVVSTGGTNPFVNWDLTNGVEGTVGTGAGTLLARSLTSVGNGVYRYSLTWVSLSTTSISYTLQVASADNTVSFQGLSQDSVICGGVQVEQRSYAGPYLPS